MMSTTMESKEHESPDKVNLEDKAGAPPPEERVSDAEEPQVESMPEKDADTQNSTDEHDGMSEEALDRLVSGVIDNMLPQFQKDKKTLNDLTQNQRILIETVQAENTKFDECAAMKDVIQTMENAKLYHNKLLQIKRDMAVLHEKSAKMKKRALKLQQQKQKEALQREADREREMEKERMLIAQPTTGNNKVS